MAHLLNNVKLLYAVFFISLVNLSYFIYNRDNDSIFLFAIISLVVYLFNNNMIVVLGSTMIFVNALILINSIPEGLENKGELEVSTVKESIKLPKLEKLNSPSKDRKEVIKELLPLTNAIDKLDIDQVNAMINNINKMIDRFSS